LPPPLTHLKLGDHFDHPVDNLPLSITHLTFGERSPFNHPINNLPQTLTHLHFGMRFNQSITHLPHSLVSLRLGCGFNQPIDFPTLPPSLAHLFTYTHREYHLPVPVAIHLR